MGYQLRTNIVKNEKGGVVANPDRGFVMWMNHFSELLNAPGVDGVRQNEIQQGHWCLIPVPLSL
jgi:hypothetical protein